MANIRLVRPTITYRMSPRRTWASSVLVEMPSMAAASPWVYRRRGAAVWRVVITTYRENERAAKRLGTEHPPQPENRPQKPYTVFASFSNERLG